MSVHQPLEPIRPGGGLRRLRRGEVSVAAGTLCSYPQFVVQLRAEIDRARAADTSVLAARIQFQPLPGTTADVARAQELPDEVIDRLRGVHDGLRVAVLSPTEAVVLVPALARRADGETLATALHATLSPPLTGIGLDHHLVPVVGAAVLDHENDSAELLLEAARLAATDGVDGSGAFMAHPYHRVRHDRRRAKEDDLRRVVADTAIGVELQPAYRLATGELEAFEAFARWTRPDGRPVPPAEFIPLAVDTGLLHRLSRQVMARALVAASAWDRRADATAVTVWFNVTPDEVRHPLFGEAVTAALEIDKRLTVGLELGPVPPSLDARDVYRTLTDLVARGARLAAGDFGVGAANLDSLARLPFDSVKVPGALVRHLVADERATAVVEHLVALAGLHDLEVTAQCVETEAQAVLVTEAGCDLGQGYHFAPPSASVGDAPDRIGDAA